MNMPTVAASSSSNSNVPMYDVFISFRGEDTRRNFTGHLYAAFRRRNIKAYMDDYNLKKGDQISPALKKAIKESKISVIIFSKDYASSTWCLDELVFILKCKKRGQIIVPVFYEIDPSDIRKQKESYGAAFVAHEERFKNEMWKVKEWRDALKAAADICGFDSRGKYEYQLVEMIAEFTLSKLTNRISSSVGIDNFKDLVGRNKDIEEVEKLFSIESSNVSVIEISGMSGIGKTTLAIEIYHRHRYLFEKGCFLPNFKEESAKQGLVSLEKTLLVELLEEDDQKLDTLSLRSTSVKESLYNKKVLIVIDDVDSSEQIEWLVGDIEFGPGSKILVTTRDSQVLWKRADVFIYTLKGLDFEAALQLFKLNAFKRNSNETSYIELSERAVSYIQGNPLALKVLGSFFDSRTNEEWKNALKKLKISRLDILKVLRISYDYGLDDMEKTIFLSIAWIFKGENRNFVESIFNTRGIQALIDKSLITINDRSEILMHDLIQEVGKEIVRKDPEKRQLMIAEEPCHAFKNTRETEKLEQLYFDMSKIGEGIHLRHPTDFQNLCNLRLLKINDSNNSNDNESKVFVRGGSQFERDLNLSDLQRLSIPVRWLGTLLPDLHEPGSTISVEVFDDEIGREFTFSLSTRKFNPKAVFKATGWRKFVLMKGLEAGDCICFWKPDVGGHRIRVRVDKMSVDTMKRKKKNDIASSSKSPYFMLTRTWVCWL